MPRRRIPDHMKVLHGTDRKDRRRPEPEFPPLSAETPPAWVTEPGAVAEWTRLVRLLQESRVLTEADVTTLGHFCNLHGACLKLYKAGMEPTAAQLTQLRLFASEFGLTPASRSKAKPLGDAKPSNPFAALGS